MLIDSQPFELACLEMGVASARTLAPVWIPHPVSPAHISSVACPQAHGAHLRLPASDTEARQQKGEEEVATLNLVLKYPDATNATYV
jgi:hypothetical protein